MLSAPVIRFVIAGQLSRDFILTVSGRPYPDTMGGSLLYAAAGLGTWETGIGLLGRVGENFPQDWLGIIKQNGFDNAGIQIIDRSVDLRRFSAYSQNGQQQMENPISHYNRLGLPFPKALLGYAPATPQGGFSSLRSPLSLQLTDIPADYLDSTAVHICPIDFHSLTLLLTSFRQSHIHQITLDIASDYMVPNRWEDIPLLLDGTTALLTSEEKIRRLFNGRSTDLWEMAEVLTGYGCECVVIKRGAQGQYIFDPGKKDRWEIPAYPARVEDPTGSGDAFCGGYIAGYQVSYDPLEAALYGNVSASLSIEGSGPFYQLHATPGLAEARLSTLRGTAHKL